MTVVVALGDYASKQNINFDLVLIHEEIERFLSDEKANNPNQAWHFGDLEIEQEMTRRVDELKSANFEVHTTLQGNRSIDYLGKVVRVIREKPAKCKIVVHRIPENIRSSIGAPEIDVEVMIGSALEHRNPARSPDYFDLLRDLSNSLQSLREEIRAINEPDRLSSEIRSTRAYIDAFLAFLDEKSGGAPDTVPAELPVGLAARLKRVNWSGFSTHAQRWVETAVKILEKLF